MQFTDKQLKHRHFKRVMFARRLRKAALHKHRGHQLSVAEYDAFCLNTQDIKCLSAICDMSESGEWGDIDWIDWWGWLMKNWKRIRLFIADLEMQNPEVGPNVAHDRAPKKRGRRSRLPSYENDADFQADKKDTLQELDEIRASERISTWPSR